jgi:hypothetical protein
MRYLRKNTAVIITVGPFYDKTDGVTIETGLTITNEKITLVADTDDGAAPTNILDNIAGAVSGTANDLNYITNNDAGLMQLELAAADVNRNGRLFLSITDAANHVPVFHEFMILPAVVYDSFVLGTDLLDVNTSQLGGTTQTGNDVGADIDTIDGIVDGLKTTLDNVHDTDLPAVKTETAAIKAKTDNLPASPAAVGSAMILSAAYDKAKDDVLTPLAVVDGIVDGLKTTLDNVHDTDLPAVKADTAAILTDTGTTLDGAISTIDGILDDIHGTDLPAVKTETAAIKAKTDNLPASPAAVGSAMTLSAAYDKAKDDVLTPLAVVDGIADAIKVKTDAYLDAAVSSRLAASAYVPSSGLGAISWTYNLKDSLGANIPDAAIWVTSDLAGTVMLASGVTDANGNVTFMLDAGTVYVWGHKAGFNFSNPDTEVVS